MLRACAAEECSWAEADADGAGEQHGHDVGEDAADFGPGFDNDDSYDNAPEHMHPLGASAEHAQTQQETGEDDVSISNAGMLSDVVCMVRMVASITMLLAELDLDTCDAILPDGKPQFSCPGQAPALSIP